MNIDRRAPVEYVNNKLLLEEFHICKENGRMSNRMASMLMLICSRYARKACYINYTYNTDMQSFALLNLVKSWKSFNPAKSSNPFAYFTSCVTNSFRQFLNQEKNHRRIRDALLVNNGLDPSFAYNEEYNAKPDEDQAEPVTNYTPSNLQPQQHEEAQPA